MTIIWNDSTQGFIGKDTFFYEQSGLLVITVHLGLSVLSWWELLLPLPALFDKIKCKTMDWISSLTHFIQQLEYGKHENETREIKIILLDTCLTWIIFKQTIALENYPKQKSNFCQLKAIKNGATRHSSNLHHWLWLPYFRKGCQWVAQEVIYPGKNS